MKKSIVLALAILALGAISAVFQRRQLAGLKESHQKLVAEGAALGVSGHPPARTPTRQKRENQAQAMEVRWTAFSEELHQYDKKDYPTDGGYQERFDRFLKGLGSIDHSRIQWLIAKVREDKEISENTRTQFLYASIRKISADRPAMALAFYDGCADLIKMDEQTHHTLTEVLCIWPHPMLPPWRNGSAKMGGNTQANPMKIPGPR